MYASSDYVFLVAQISSKRAEQLYDEASYY